MTKFVVEKGVPMPLTRGWFRPCPYPFADMAIGDSFVIQSDKDPERERKNVINRAKNWRDAQQADFAIETRIIDGCCRVWRVAYKPRPKNSPPPPDSYLYLMDTGKKPKKRKAA